MTYTAPIADMVFALVEVAGHPADDDTLRPILDEAAKLAGGVLAPVNRSGDIEGAVLENGVVRAPKGFKHAYERFVAGGWNAVPCDPAFGGQGLPWTVATPVAEMWNSANMAFALCPLLNQGAIELLSAHGSPAQKALYLRKMISGEWTGTMNLTEPQAGSDLGLLKTRAEPRGDHYRIRGQKIFITWGEHDMAANTVHMVLARTPKAPPGSKGISLFLVPKILVGADGTLNGRNDLRCVSIEHKLGINGSPTCVMAYGDNDGAIGFMVGEENRGLEAMFTMMNNERMGVGMQGVAIAERAYQQARDYARQRIQGRDLKGGRETVPIVRHPDVKRMLLTMKAGIDAIRALTYYTAAQMDRAKQGDAAAQARVDLLTPVVKAWNTDLGCEIASLGVQVHGGMGFIEETGAAQHFRDARIAPIYEGTNGIQAQDLAFRKVARDGGKAMRALIAEMDGDFKDGLGIASEAAALDALENTTAFMVKAGAEAPELAAAAATPYLRLVGTVAGQWVLTRQAKAAERRLKEGGGDRTFLELKTLLARFYARSILPQAMAQAMAAAGGEEIVSLDEAAL
ncbi:MAG: acyl-CoA dehydrogenase [Alphaproteobacteria bacterium]|nr:acyl-CoA dehydrogenase [Alphaproteobacteria bacterium]